MLTGMQKAEDSIKISEVQIYNSISLSQPESGIRYSNIVASDVPTGYSIIGLILRGYTNASSLFSLYVNATGASIFANKGSAVVTIDQLKIQWVFGKTS